MGFIKVLKQLKGRTNLIELPFFISYLMGKTFKLHGKTVEFIEDLKKTFTCDDCILKNSELCKFKTEDEFDCTSPIPGVYKVKEED